VFGLSILLSSFAGEPIAARRGSADLPYIEQALGMLDVMSECSVARNVGKFVRELMDMLVNTKTRHSGQGTTAESDSAVLNPSVSVAFGDVSEMGGFGFDINSFTLFNDTFLSGLEGVYNGFQENAIPQP
jgi:hypothetical protein